jgi:uncharacterized protein (DUF1778 family)
MTTTDSRKKDPRESRINVRTTDRERQVLQQAADAAGKTLTAFVLDAANREAERALADRRFFVLDAGQWDKFQEALDRPAEDKPGLRALLRNPVVVDE